MKLTRGSHSISANYGNTLANYGNTLANYGNTVPYLETDLRSCNDLGLIGLDYIKHM